MTVLDISQWKPEKAQYYRSLIAHRRDMEYAREYLNQMFFSVDTSLIDGALISAAIQLLVKCFTNQSVNGRRQLNPEKVFRKYAKTIGEEDLTKQYFQFSKARNTVLAHDESDHSRNIVGMVVTHSTGEAVDIAEVTNRTGYLYRQNQTVLLKMVDLTHRYLDERIGKLRSSLIEEYNSLPKKPCLERVSCDNIPMATAW